MTWKIFLIVVPCSILAVHFWSATRMNCQSCLHQWPAQLSSEFCFSNLPQHNRTRQPLMIRYSKCSYLCINQCVSLQLKRSHSVKSKPARKTAYKRSLSLPQDEDSIFNNYIKKLIMNFSFKPWQVNNQSPIISNSAVYINSRDHSLNT